MKRRYRRPMRRAGALSPWAIAGICLGAVILITVIVGNLLTLWLDDETYNRLTAGEEDEQEVTPVHKTALPNINAYPHVLGSDPAKTLDFPATSISLNKPDGTLNYTSDVSKFQHLTGDDKVPLDETMRALSLYTTYVSGVFYPQAFTYDTEDLRFSSTAAEAALIREFLRAGAKDLVLADIPFDGVVISEIISYVQAVKNAAGDAAIGVAVPLSVAERQGSWELLNTLLEICDFCLLDVSGIAPREDGTIPSPAEILADADYFLTQYDMRLLLTDQQTDLRAEIELRMIADYQIIKAPPAAKTGEEQN